MVCRSCSFFSSISTICFKKRSFILNSFCMSWSWRSSKQVIILMLLFTFDGAGFSTTFWAKLKCGSNRIKLMYSIGGWYCVLLCSCHQIPKSLYQIRHSSRYYSTFESLFIIDTWNQALLLELLSLYNKLFNTYYTEKMVCWNDCPFFFYPDWRF